MKTEKDKKSNKKFDLEKMNVAKLKNIHLINGGENDLKDDPINTTNKIGQNSSRVCNKDQQIF